MKRRDIVRMAGAPIALAACEGIFSATPRKDGSSNTPVSHELSGPQFRLTLRPDQNLHCRLVHVPSGTVLADGPYFYSFGSPRFSSVRKERDAILLEGETATGAKVEQRFALDAEH